MGRSWCMITWVNTWYLNLVKKWLCQHKLPLIVSESKSKSFIKDIQWFIEFSMKFHIIGTQVNVDLLLWKDQLLLLALRTVLIWKSLVITRKCVDLSKYQRWSSSSYWDKIKWREIALERWRNYLGNIWEHCITWFPRVPINLTLKGNKTSSKLLLFSNSGKLLYTWSLPMSQDIKSMSWQAGSLQLSLAIDTNLVLCIARTNAKYSHLKWTYLDESSTLIFSQAKSCSSNNWITFWNLDSKQIHTRYSICRFNESDMCADVLKDLSIWKVLVPNVS